MGWGVSLEDGVFVYGMECLYTGWSGGIRDGLLLIGMGC